MTFDFVFTGGNVPPLQSFHACELCEMLRAMAAQKKGELTQAQSSAGVQKEKPLNSHLKTMIFAQ